MRRTEEKEDRKLNRRIRREMWWQDVDWWLQDWGPAVIFPLIAVGLFALWIFAGIGIPSPYDLIF